MPRHLLLCAAPVERLLVKISALPCDQRKMLWRAYRRLRQAPRVSPLPLQSTVAHFVDAVRAGWPLLHLSLALKLALAYTSQRMSKSGAACRANRLVYEEYYRLVRLHVRAALGLRALPPLVAWQTKLPVSAQAWRAVCDGSQKSSRSAIGIEVYDPAGRLRAQVSFAVAARSSLEVELQACLHALHTLQAFSAAQAVVEVDALCVVCALQARLPARYCVEEAELRAEAAQFEALRVVRVSRVITQGADRLAGALSKHNQALK